MKGLKYIIIGIIVIGILAVVFRQGGPSSPFKCRLYGHPDIQASRAISLALQQYAVDHNGRYPEGRSSTEIFQKLLDEGYVYDATVFFIPMRNKVDGRGLKQIGAENVCWDITSGISPIDSDDVPLVYTTGFRLSYHAGGSATPILKFSPSFHQAFLHWWDSDKNPAEHICVSYLGNTSRQITLQSDGTASTVIPTDFDPKGKTYRQLTPDGELPP